MRFKTDENLPVEAAEFFRRQGCDAHSVLEEQIGGASDVSIAEVCQREGRILVTCDLDFANIRSFPPESYPGIVVLRLKRQDKGSVLAILPRIHRLFGSERIAGRLWVVDESRTRIFGAAEA